MSRNLPELTLAALTGGSGQHTAFGRPLAPITIRTLVRLAKTPLIDHTLRRAPTPEELALACATVLGVSEGLFLQTILHEWEGTIRAQLDAVAAHINAAFATFVAPDAGDNSTPRTARFGWPLELVEFLMSEYKMPFESALDTPLPTAFALQACAHARNGGKFSGPGYVEAETLAQLLTTAQTHSPTDSSK